MPMKSRFLLLLMIFIGNFAFAFEWGGVLYNDDKIYSIIGEIEKQQKTIHTEIYNKFNNEFQNSDYNRTVQQKRANANITGPITDGLSDIKKYLKSEVKIMWILKEPYDDYAKGLYYGGGWSITDDGLKIKPQDFIEGKARNTWLPIAYISEGVKNGVSNVIELKETETSILCEDLQSIAYINISKIPQGSTTDDKTLPWKYEFWKDIIQKQIKLYKPDVIIFGNTLKYVMDDLPGGYWDYPVIDVQFKNWKILQNNNSLFVGAYHPQYSGGRGKSIGCTVETYCETIINLILEYKSLKTKARLQDAA